MSSAAHASPAPASTRPDRAPAVRRVLLTILVLNGLVLVVKIVVGWRTGSLSVLGAALESGLDMLNNLIGMAVAAVAARAPDEDHPYGHDKFETVGALGIVGFLSISCFELLREGIAQVVAHRSPRPPATAEVALLASTLLANVLIVWYERRRGRALHSPFLLADAEHTRADIFVTGLALTSLVLTRLGFGRLDPVLAIAVALLIAWSGQRILRHTIPVLVDARAVDAADLRRVVGDVGGVEDVRLVRSRYNASGLLFAEVTIGVAGSISVADAHAIADAVEARIAERLGAGEVTVHVEPA
ncbi:MAG TPA: cation diffusion facilitator family transporter [Gemmatimonadaceae bacterium]|nr:cation diffusion facilitator family transporter [Gemmatimonadaceae bacterium]